MWRDCSDRGISQGYNNGIYTSTLRIPMKLLRVKEMLWGFLVARQTLRCIPDVFVVVPLTRLAPPRCAEVLVSGQSERRCTWLKILFYFVGKAERQSRPSLVVVGASAVPSSAPLSTETGLVRRAAVISQSTSFMTLGSRSLSPTATEQLFSVVALNGPSIRPFPSTGQY